MCIIMPLDRTWTCRYIELHVVVPLRSIVLDTVVRGR